MNLTGFANASRPFPLLRGVLPLNRGRIPADVVAGMTLAALGIPEVMGYTKISGTPVVTGLYTLLVPVIAFGVIGGSRHLVVAADSATAAVLASLLVSVAALGTPEYVRLTSCVALVVAGMLVLARVFKLGFLADFLSRSALVGFLTGVGVQVACGDLAGLLGLPKEGHGAVAQAASALARLGSTHLTTLGISAAVLAILAGGARLSPRAPAALVAVVGAIAASATFDLAGRGVATIGNVPSGLPSLALPIPRAEELYQVVACAASCFLVILAQSAATARAYALRYDEDASEDSDLVGLAAANAAAGITGTFVVNGSPTKTEMVDAAGGRSQIAHLVTATVVLMVLLFLTRPLGLLPSAVLSAIVFWIGVKLVDLKGMAELWRLQRSEFWIAAITAATVVARDAIAGIGVAVVLSLIEHVRHTYRPRTRVLVPRPGGGWDSVPPARDLLAAPGVLAYRFEANLFYANAGFFMDELLRLVSSAKHPVRGVILDTTGIDDIDYSAAKMLVHLRRALQKRDIAMAVVVSYHVVLDVLTRFGVVDGRDEWNVHHSLDTAIATLQRSGSTAASTS
ncbi:MAG TPA: SulP family inorganic anion transporter [Anaeromyxobacteraceae bacterium]|nr:SulP family inorganic anion transporter [Anaeromyxobacteraceae bacterium]